METYFYNAEGVDATTFGNHEFDFGFTNLLNIFRDNHFSTLVSNIDVKQDKEGSATRMFMDDEW